MRGEDGPAARGAGQAEPDLGALVASRICHDLVSPLGAIGNGVELLAMAGSAGGGAELTLIAESAASASARARLLRLAFGVAGAEQEVPGAELRTLLAAFSAGSRLALDWQVEGTVPQPQARLALLCLLCLESAMAWGGAITLSRTGPRWEVRGEASRFRDLALLWRVYDGAAGKVGAAEVQFALAPLRAAELGLLLTRREEEGRITLGFTPVI